MNPHPRLTRLRELTGRLEQLAPSPGRDALLRRVRHRAVALDAGERASSSAWSQLGQDRSSEVADASILLEWVEERTSFPST